MQQQQMQQPPHMQQKTKGMPGPGGPPNPYNCPPGMPMKGMGFGGNGPGPGGPGMGSPNHPGMGAPGGDFNHMGNWNPVLIFFLSFYFQTFILNRYFHSFFAF